MLLVLTLKQGFLIWIIVVLVGMFMYYYKKNFCFIHYHWKDMKAYHPCDSAMYCSSCIEDQCNPKVDCECGFSGRFHELLPSQEVSERVNYHCPKCNKKYEA